MVLKKRWILFIGALAMAATWMFPVVGSSEADTLEKVVVQAGWLLNGEYSMVCSAIVNGYYAREGLEIELRPGGPSGTSFLISTVLLAQDEQIDIAIDGDIVNLLRGRANSEDLEQQLRVKLFAAFWQENPLGFIVRADSPLFSLKDLAHTKPDGTKYVVGAPAGAVILEALAEYIGVAKEDIDIVQVGFDATPFLAGQVDAYLGFWTTQAYEVERAGVPYRFLPLSEIPGFSQPSQVALARDETLRARPEMLEKWLRATIEGARFNILNPDESGRQIRDPRCGGPNFDVDQETWLIKNALPLFEFEGSPNRIGFVNRNQVLTYAAAYAQYGQIPRVPAASELIDFSVLERVYDVDTSPDALMDE